MLGGLYSPGKALLAEDCHFCGILPLYFFVAKRPPRKSRLE